MMICIPYLILVIILFCLYTLEKNPIYEGLKKRIIILAYFILLIFIGLRGHIMSDFITYYPFYKNLPNIVNIEKFDFTKYPFEPGFVMYSSLVKTLFDNYFIWIFVNTLIDSLVFAYVFRRYCKSMILPLIFFVVFNGIIFEFNLYRNVKAIDCFLLSIQYVLNKKLYKYICLNLIGFLFHTSALIYLPLYFIINLHFSNVVILSLFIVSNIIFLFNISVINNAIENIQFLQVLQFYDKINQYSNSAETYKFSIGYFERTFAFVLFFYYRNKLIKQHKSNNLFFNCFLFYYFSFLIFFEVKVFVERVPNLFIFSYWILYPNLLLLNIKNRQIISIVVGLICLLKVYAGYSGPAEKYENILITKPDYNYRRNVYETVSLNR